MKITLQVEGTKHVVELTEDGITLGRGDAATIRVISNAVSRIHAKLFLKDGRPHVMDMKSLNGTTLNGLPVTAPAPIQPGDAIQLGEVSIQWVPDAPPRQGGTPSAPWLRRTPHGVPDRLEDRAFDASGSIMVPHASLEAMLARHKERRPWPRSTPSSSSSRPWRASSSGPRAWATCWSR